MDAEPEPHGHTDTASASEPNPPIEFYWRPGCPYCSSLRRALARRGVPLEMRNIWDDPDAAATVRSAAAGNETVPTVSIAGRFLVNPSPDAVLRLAETVAPALVASLRPRRVVAAPGRRMSSRRFDLVVVGGGAGGISAAKAAARRRHSVAIVQDGPVGGDCTFTGCVPSKALLAAAARGDSFADATTAVRRAVATIAATENPAALSAEHITVVAGRGHVRSPHLVEIDGTVVHAGRLIIATGARPLVPPIAGLAELDYLTNENLFHLDQQPTSLAILGGGPIGCEMAQAFARLGTTVTLVEAMPRLLPREEPEVSPLAAAALQQAGVTIRVGAAVTAVEPTAAGVRLVFGGDDEPAVEAARLLVAIGRAPSGRGFGLEELGVEIDQRGAVVVDDTLATSVSGVWAIGDVTGRLPFTHVAAQMGFLAVRNAFDRTARLHPARFDTAAIPWVTFTDPECAHVGMTEAEAVTVGAKVAELPLTAVDRAVAVGRTDGFVKLIAAPRKLLGWAGGGRLVGATIVAPTAGELISECALAIQTSMFTGRLAQTVHPYPAWSVAIQQAAAQFLFEIDGRRARPARPS